MKISVVLPTYNREHLILRAMQSVLEQSFGDLELIIVDDASTDDTARVVAGIADKRVRYFRLDRRGGACAARNRGIDEAQGEYIAFQDSDDRWHPQKLARQLAVIQNSQADMVFCAFHRHGGSDDAGEIFPPVRIKRGFVAFDDLLMENLASTQTILARREAISDIRFRPDFPRLQDWEMLLRFSKRYRIWYEPDVLADIYIQPDSISRNTQKGLEAYRTIYEENKADIQKNKDTDILFCVTIAAYLRELGNLEAAYYFQRMHKGLGLWNNLRLFKAGAKLWMKQLIKG